ncbi:DUF4035 domain-containing protein [Salinisphaera sp. LB1]|uniref:phage tail assembly protein T n=1 Tax=Salinisphaera sp. LB1 TaxID=2183911 RepID=UPI000D7D42A1|nr:DUF4035 domain-containing protein [Salinisphaera sp. LB1]AWN17676.1 hypothetical protein SALB1_3482 [Salinisphaera sp. LB1]
MEEISSAEYDDWYYYAQHEPIGPARHDYNNAMLCTLLANINRGEKSKPFTMHDFLHFEEQPEKKKHDPVDLSEMIKVQLAGMKSSNR